MMSKYWYLGHLTERLRRYQTICRSFMFHFIKTKTELSELFFQRSISFTWLSDSFFFFFEGGLGGQKRLNITEDRQKGFMLNGLV